MAGDTLVTLALAGSLFFSISPTAARGRVTLSLVLTMAPFAIVAPFLGPVIDRSRQGRRAMVMASCGLRALACLAMARVIDGLVLFPVAFAILVLSKGYSVAKSALVPAAVSGDDELVEANAKLAITGIVAGFLVAGPGVLLLRVFSAKATLMAAAVLFTAAAATGIRLPTAAVQRPTEGAPPATGAAPRSPVRSMNSEVGLVAAAVAMALLRAEVGFLTFLVAFGFRRSGAPSWWFGLVLGASMAATLLGNAIAPRLRAVAREERILTAALVLVALSGVGLARLEGRLWAVGVAAAIGLATGAGKLAFDSLVQRDAPALERGRSFARYEAGFQLVWVVGALLPVVVTTPLRQGFDVLGLGAALAAVAYLFTERRLQASP